MQLERCNVSAYFLVGHVQIGFSKVGEGIAAVLIFFHHIGCIISSQPLETDVPPWFYWFKRFCQLSVLCQNCQNILHKRASDPIECTYSSSYSAAWREAFVAAITRRLKRKQIFTHSQFMKFSIEACLIHITLPPQQMDQRAYLGYYFSSPSCPRYRSEEMSGVLRSWPVTCNPTHKGKDPVHFGLVTHFISREEKPRYLCHKRSPSASSPFSDWYWKIH